TQPVISVKIIPPKPAPIAASPHVLPTRFFGNTSEGKLSVFAKAPVYPAIAMATNPIESHTFETRTAGIAESIRTAKKVTVVLRATVTVQPRLSRSPQPQPPRRFPKPATMKGIQPYFPIDSMLKWRAFLRYSGNQKV